MELWRLEPQRMLVENEIRLQRKQVPIASLVSAFTSQRLIHRLAYL
jgi:hypothetical protein